MLLLSIHFLYALLKHYVQVQMLLAKAKAEVQQEQKKPEKHYVSDNPESKYPTSFWWTLVLVFFTALLASNRRKNPLESKHLNIHKKEKILPEASILCSVKITQCYRTANTLCLSRKNKKDCDCRVQSDPHKKPQRCLICFTCHF